MEKNLQRGETSTRHFGRGHLVPLDGVRGIAILAVMFSHLLAVNYQTASWPLRVVGYLAYYGWMGVDLFFVLSGFLITGILVDSREGPGYFRNFYARRFLRIFPLYYVVLFVLFFCGRWLRLDWHGTFVAHLLYLQNLPRYAEAVFDVSPFVAINHLWSLAIEEQFYLAWPLFVYFARTRGRVLATAAIAMLCSTVYRLWLLHHGAPYFAVHTSTLCRAESLLLGGVLAMLFRHPPRWRLVQRYAPAVFGVCAAMVLASILLAGRVSYLTSEVWLQGWRYSLIALRSGALLTWSLQVGPLQQFCSLRLLRFFGKYSYGLYVLHMILLPSLMTYARQFLSHYTQNRAVLLLGSVLFTLAVSIAASVVSFHLLEKPFLRLKKFFDYKQVSSPGAAVAAKCT